MQGIGNRGGGRSRHDPTALHRTRVRSFEAGNHRRKNEVRPMADVTGRGYSV